MFTVATTYVVISCCSCRALFAVPDQVHAELRRTGAWFYCPGGHKQQYTESTATQLQREKDAHARTVARLDQIRADRDAIERSRRAIKGQVTRVKRRISNGVCPCCNRTFADLAAHMTNKHPDYAAEPAVEH